MNSPVSLSQKIAAVIAEAGKFAAGDAVAYLGCLKANLDDLLPVGVVASVLPEAVVFGSALELAQYAEQAHLEILQHEKSEDVWGSEAESSLGNLVFVLCIDNGLDLEDDDGYCNKATPEEICAYNLGRLATALSNKDGK